MAKDADCVLLGPKVSYRLAEVQGLVARPTASIDMRTYGMMDGQKALEQALELIGE